jgi:hypothetical protein
MLDRIPLLFTKKQFVAELRCTLLSDEKDLDDNDIDWWMKELLAKEFLSVNLRETYRQGLHVYELDITILNDVVGPTSIDEDLFHRAMNIAREMRLRKLRDEK